MYNTQNPGTWSNSKVGIGIKDTFKVISIPIGPSPTNNGGNDKLLPSPGLILSYCNADGEQVATIRDKLTELNYKVWTCQLPIDNESCKENRDVSNVLLNCQYYILLLTEHSMASPSILDQLSLAKLAGKKICILSTKPVEDIYPDLGFPLLFVLASCHWIVIQDSTVSNIDVLSGILPISNRDDNVICYKASDLVQKLTSLKTTVSKTQKRGGFWDRNFGNEQEVLLTSVVQRLISDYQFDCQTVFTDDDWMVDILRNWSFVLPESRDVVTRDVVTRDLYTRFIFSEQVGKVEDPDQFWLACKRSFMKYLTLGTVFGLNSTVRYGAIEHINEIQDVKPSLLKLLRSRDATMRAVACICVGRNKDLVNNGSLLAELLSDGDRMVRKCACRGLARLMYTQATQKLLAVWRNDNCVDVRLAALEALKQLGDAETLSKISCFELLERELAELA